MRQRFQSAERRRPPLPAEKRTLKTWLTDRGSLTRRLQSVGDFSVTLLTQCLTTLPREEANELGLHPKQRAQVREVILHCNSNPVVFAHSLLPCLPRGILAHWLSRLGNRPLAALFFQHPGFRRGPLLAYRLDRRHALFHRAVKALQLGSPTPRTLWARRSGFSFGRQTVWVTEIFSPEITRLNKP